MKNKRLGVNIDHVATIRNARGANYPDPLRAALEVEKSGADSLTIHLREDRRHINDIDAKKICGLKNVLVNLEISMNKKIVNKALKIKPNFIVKAGDKKAAVSTWVSAKRTRSYPFVRIYKTLSHKNMKKITIFPVVKDEGRHGCRDYIQWDTFSMCSYLNVYTIHAYYVKAGTNIRNPRKPKITAQKYDSGFISKQIKSILKTGDDAKAWNKKMIELIKDLVPHIIENYERIAENTHVIMHDMGKLREGLERRSNPEEFRKLSRGYAIGAQKRESSTDQPKEKVFGLIGYHLF